MGSLSRKRQWLLSAAALALFLVASWSTGGPRGRSSAESSRWGGGSHSACRESLAATSGSFFGRRQPRLDGYGTCECATVQSIRDPFYSSSGTYISREMEPDAAHPAGNVGSVLLLSHGRLQRLDLVTRDVKVLLHRPGLRIRGVFSDGIGSTDLPEIHVLLTTPSLDRDSRFMGVDGRLGKVVYDVPAEGSRDAHDVVRHGDEIFVVSTGTGEVRVYDGAQPGRFPLLRSMAAADPTHPGASHINTVGVSPSTVWVMRHNQGKLPAEVHVLDRYAERSLDVYADVGRSSHGLAHWHDELIVLDSLNGRVLAVHRLTKATRVVWSCSRTCFLKGLAVVGSTALVGVAPPQRRMDRMHVNCSLVAISLADNGKVQWRLDPVEANGLRSAAADSASNRLITAGLLNQIVPLSYASDPAAKQPLQHVALIPLVLKLDTVRNIDAAGVKQPIGYRMLGGISISDARAALQRDWKEAWTSAALSAEHMFAPGLNTRFPGVQHLRLLFSTGERIESLGGFPTDTCVMMPGWRRFGSVIYPMLVQLFERRLGLTRGSWEQRLLRVQLNSMPPGSEILPHSDTGSYARNAHRIHIPLIVPQCVQFEQRLPQIGGGDASWSEVPFKEGEAFEVNNLLPHHVQQHGPYERVTLILDLADTPCRRTIEVSDQQKCPGFQKRWWASKDCVLDEDVTLEEWRAAAGVG